jgi:hypothetical protein
LTFRTFGRVKVHAFFFFPAQKKKRVVCRIILATREIGTDHRRTGLILYPKIDGAECTVQYSMHLLPTDCV